MLVLHSRPNEIDFVIDGPCRVRVTPVRGGRARLGFIATNDVQITREKIANFSPKTNAVAHKLRKREDRAMRELFDSTCMVGT